MREEDLALLRKAAKYENRDLILSLTLRTGEVLHARILCLPCDCGDCTDTNVIYEQVWSSSEATRARWERDRRERNVGGYGVPIDLIERVEVVPIKGG
jgi:hypothetical protein